MYKILSIGVFAAFATAHSVSAAVVDGLVTSGSGSFEQILDPTGLTVGLNNQQSDSLFAFNEQQNFELTEDLVANIGGTIEAGTIVSSHYVFFDPVAASQEGYVDFDSEILGIVTETGDLLGTDFLGLETVEYLNPTLRGLEAGDSAEIDSEIASRLLVDWFAATPGDYIRVITAGDLLPVPLPASGLLLLGGLGVIAATRRRRKS